SCQQATILPRLVAGANSAMYIGAVVEAMPTPMPPRNREAISTPKAGEKAQPIAESRNAPAAPSRTAFLPNRSLSQLVNAAPMMQPIIAQLTNQPSDVALSENCAFTRLRVPEMTAISKPYTSPPSATIKQMTCAIGSVISG